MCFRAVLLAGLSVLVWGESAGGAGPYWDAKNNVLVYHLASKPAILNVVIRGEDFTGAEAAHRISGWARKSRAEPQILTNAAGPWEALGWSLAQNFLEAPLIRDYSDYFNVFIFFPGSSTPEQAAGVETKIMLIYNRSDYVWNATVGGNLARGDRKADYQFVIHEFVGHAFASLADEYPSTAAAVWGDRAASAHGTPTAGNVNGHAFPGRRKPEAAPGTQDYEDLVSRYIDEVNWPDVPGGPMAWADSIFGGPKGDGVFYTYTAQGRVSGRADSRRAFFPNHPLWGTANYPDAASRRAVGALPPNLQNPEKKWPKVSVNGDSAGGQNGEPGTPWEEANNYADGSLTWRHWPSWVVFLGRPGYWDEWIVSQGGANHSFVSSVYKNCCMRQASRRFCVPCRYRIWVEIERRIHGRPYSWYYMTEDPVTGLSMDQGDFLFSYKFPSEAGLREFVPYDQPRYSTLAKGNERGEGFLDIELGR